MGSSYRRRALSQNKCISPHDSTYNIKVSEVKKCSVDYFFVHSLTLLQANNILWRHWLIHALFQFHTITLSDVRTYYWTHPPHTTTTPHNCWRQILPPIVGRNLHPPIRRQASTWSSRKSGRGWTAAAEVIGNGFSWVKPTWFPECGTIYKGNKTDQMEYNLLHEKHCYRKQIISKNPHNIGFVSKKKREKEKEKKNLQNLTFSIYFATLSLWYQMLLWLWNVLVYTLGNTGLKWLRWNYLSKKSNKRKVADSVQVIR